MRQVPKTSSAALYTLFGVIVLDILSINIITPVLASAVNNTASTLFGMAATSATRHIFYGLIQALSPLCYIVGAPVLGYISDRIGRRKVLLLCLIGSFVSLVCSWISFATSDLLLLLLGRVIAGLTSGSLAVAQSAIADLSTGAEKARNIAQIAFAMTIGLVVGPLVGGVLSDPSVYSGFNTLTPFYVGMILSLLNIVLLLKTFRETHESTKVSNQFWHNLVTLLRHKKLYRVLTLFFIFEAGWSLYFQSLPLLFAQDFHASNKIIGFFSAYAGLMLSLSLLYGVRTLVKYYQLTAFIKPSFLFGAIALMIGYFTHSVLAQILVAIPITFITACLYATLITIGSDRVGTHFQGLYMGVTDAVLALAFTITAFLSGVLTIHQAIFPQLIAAIIFVIGFFSFRLLGEI